jgi:hypothetical protein
MKGLLLWLYCCFYRQAWKAALFINRRIQSGNGPSTKGVTPMRNFNLEYVKKLVPELMEAECQIVMEELLVDFKADDIYPDAVRDYAKRLFPIVMSSKVTYINGRNHVEQARVFVDSAEKCLNRVQVKSDELAQIQLDMKAVIHYLNEELKAMKEQRHAK